MWLTLLRGAGSLAPVVAHAGTSRPGPSSPSFRIERVDAGPGRALVRLSGSLDFDEAADLWAALDRHRDVSVPLEIDLAGLEHMDGASAALLLAFAAEVEARGQPVALSGAQGRVETVLSLHRSRASQDEAPAARPGFLARVGVRSEAAFDEFRTVAGFAGQVVRAGLLSLRRPGSVYWRAVPRLMERAGADAVPIVFLITFLMGLIMAFMASVQLRQVGANIFVADLVALAMTREFGPLMTAIIAAGRSGAAFAAELGTMEVSEEIDALQTLGLDPYRFLVFPRLFALCAMLPLLTLLADAVGICGGMVVAFLSLDITPAAFFNQAQASIGLWDVYSGVLKSVFFAAAVGLIACQRGLATRGGAEGVGRSTTSAVVVTLFALVAIDSAFTVLFHVFGL